MIFEGLVIALDLGYSVSFKKEAELRKKVVDEGGTISYIVTKKCNFMVTSETDKVSVSLKCCMALKHGLPVLKLDYLWDCLDEGVLKDSSSYELGGRCKMLDFMAGKIGIKNAEEKKKVSSRASFNPRAVKIWYQNGPQMPDFDENEYEIAKFVFFKIFNNKNKCDQIHVLELQVSPMNPVDSNRVDGSRKERLRFRVVNTATNTSSDLTHHQTESCEFRFVPTSDQAIAVFSMLYQDLVKRGAIKVVPPQGIGSQTLQNFLSQKEKYLECSPDDVKEVKAGLQSLGGGQVELQRVDIRAKLVDLTAQVVVLQEYQNNSQHAIEAKYVFPLDDTAAVCGFEAFINGKHILGEVKEKETAHREYKEAISQGHGANLMDQEETPDVFTVSVGNLPPAASVLIKITYVAELSMYEGCIDFELPESVAPWRENAAFNQQTQKLLKRKKVSSSNTTLQIAVEMPFDILSLDCPSHGNESWKEKKTGSKAYLEMLEDWSLDDGFQMIILLAEIHAPRMWVEKLPGNDGKRACMLTFYPEFEWQEMPDNELLLILDTSNSMAGNSLTDAKEVALLLLDALPPDCFFNVARFGSDYEEVFPGSVKLDDGNFEAAEAFIEESVANGGSTGLQGLLQSYHLLPHSAMRSAFLISDGHINSPSTVLQLARENAHHLRVFTLGVRNPCNGYWLKSLSRVSGGAHEFFDSKTEAIWESKVTRLLSKASQPGLTSVSVEWQQHDETLATLQAPRHSLFSGSPQVFYKFAPNCTMATLKANVDGQEMSTVVSTSELSITEGQLVHRLAARAVIRDVEEGLLSSVRTQHEMAKMDMKSLVIDLSKEFSIVTQFTSFIAVEKTEEATLKANVDGQEMSTVVTS